MASQIIRLTLRDISVSEKMARLQEAINWQELSECVKQDSCNLIMKDNLPDIDVKITSSFIENFQKNRKVNDTVIVQTKENPQENVRFI